jgi:Ca2+-binding EF-hand superfamily protein
MDRTGDGKVTFDDLQGVYKVNKHPKFLSGELTEAQVFREFLDSFDAVNHKDGVITYQEFVDYFAGVSASIDSDIYFDCMMRQCWKI